MSDDIRLEYDQLPAVTPSYLRAATTFSGGLPKNGTIPSITATVRGLEVRAEELAKYRKVCGFPHSAHLPVTYPHVLAFPVHMAVLTHKKFPLKLLGLIHIRNEITQHRRIAADERVDIVVSVGGHNDVDKGIEFDLKTEVMDAQGKLIWEEVGVMLSRQPGSSGSSKSKSSKPGSGKKYNDGAGFEPEASSIWKVPADIGRRYARAAGDFNPIHLSPWTAKLFGFPRAIATGMWTKAHAAAELEPKLVDKPYTLSLAFKKPVFLPSTAKFGYRTDADGADFALTNEKGDVLHLRGEVRYL